ncbi:hypothetical protein RUM44_007114 [Polyplax serrata]|uniref:Uncharacterized protein n=1 Tax=Polyplax serrata TaxID=468196 RepID=A0ABR1B096_POLSC
MRDTQPEDMLVNLIFLEFLLQSSHPGRYTIPAPFGNTFLRYDFARLPKQVLGQTDCQLFSALRSGGARGSLRDIIGLSGEVESDTRRWEKGMLNESADTRQ